MKDIFMKTLVLLFFIGTSQLNLSSQEIPKEHFSYDIQRVYEPLSIAKDQLETANNLLDLNQYYKSSWIKEYESVEISATHNGTTKLASSNNDILTDDQKTLMRSADHATNISVIVKYLPDNNLKQNDIQEISFSFLVQPDNDAIYPGGQLQMREYLKTNVLDQISIAKFRQYQLAVVKFIIDEQGNVTNPSLFWTSENDDNDRILLKAIRNMPSWLPASYNDGPKVKQEFALTVGDTTSCVINLININQG